MWTCPTCKRQFTQTNQRHRCGTGEPSDVVRNRPASVVRLYQALEQFAKSLGDVELVTRERYVLLRTTRIFADAVVMTDALRLAIHLPRRVEHPLFEKVGADRRHVTHVARLRTLSEFNALRQFLREAYESSLGSSSVRRSKSPEHRR